MTIRLIPGIRALDPRDTLGALRDRLRACGHTVEIVSYGYVLIPLTNAIATNAVLAASEPGDLLVGYSNGGLTAVQAAECGARPRALVLITPALNVLHEFPTGISRIVVCYARDDRAMPWARRWRRVTRLMPWRWRNPHAWGAMGRDGYQGRDPRVTQIDITGQGHSWHGHTATVARVAEIIQHTAVHAVARTPPPLRAVTTDEDA